MIKITAIFCIILIFFNKIAFASELDVPIAIDSRIKTFVYSENEIFPIVLHYGYQTAIEFGKDEAIQTYSVGNQFVWQFSAVGRTLFIRPLEDNIVTNMTVLTNKRRYYFELYSRLASSSGDEEIAYVVRFFYPDSAIDSIKVATNIQKEEITVIKPYNFNYQITGVKEDILSSVFDNGINTFFKTKNPIHYIKCDGNNITHKVLGEYLVINKLCKAAEIGFKDHIAIIKSMK